MAYKITLNESGFSDFLSITEKEFLEIRKAKKAILHGVALEEKLDHVLENFADFERDLLNMALEHSIFPGKIDVLLDGGVHLVNRRIVNLLTTTRLYIDQVLHDLSEIFGEDSEQCKGVKQSICQEYDSVLGYRVMEALRNYAQHRSLPTHVITFGATWDESLDFTGLRFYVVPSVEVLALEDPKFKKAVLRELTELADEDGHVDLLPFVRQYVEALARIHHGVREVTGPRLFHADKLIAEYLTKGQDRFGRVVGLVAFFDSDTPGQYAEVVHLTDRFTKRRNGLERKNKSLKLMSRRYVSSKV